MKKDKLNSFIGQNVIVSLFDGSVLKGELHKTENEQFNKIPELHFKPKYYFCVGPYLCIFRASHVKAIKQEVKR